MIMNKVLLIHKDLLTQKNSVLTHTIKQRLRKYVYSHVDDT